MSIHPTIDLFLRLPPIYLIQSLLDWDYDNQIFKSDNNTIVEVNNIVKYFLLIIILLICGMMVILPAIQLLSIYATSLTVFIVYLSYLINVLFVKDQIQSIYSADKDINNDLTLEAHDSLYKNLVLSNSVLYVHQQLVNIFSQTLEDRLPSVASILFSQIILAQFLLRLQNQVFLLNIMPLGFDSKIQNSVVFRIYLFSFFPLILLIFPMPIKCMVVFPIVSLLCSVYNLGHVIKITHWNLCSHIKLFPLYLQIGVNENGILGFIEEKWHQIDFPNLLRALFIYIITFKLYFMTFPKTLDDWTYYDWKYLVLELVLAGTNNIISLLATTSAISYCARKFGNLFVSFIGSTREEDKYFGQVCAITFLIISLQTGITSLSGDKRLFRIYTNTCLVVLASLHFLHSSTDVKLQSIAVSNIPQIIHIKLLSLICLFASSSAIFAQKLWDGNVLSPWLLAAVAIGLELTIKCIISIILYILLIIEIRPTSKVEDIEDYIYYVKGTGRATEFIFGVFLFFNGAWIFFFESGGAIRACVICVHAYFNIYCQAKLGWKSYIQRQLSWKHIQELPCATKEQLQKYADVCSVCYQELDNARITNCNHMFHAVCLRKWLSVQNTCPLCHNIINSAV